MKMDELAFHCLPHWCMHVCVHTHLHTHTPVPVCTRECMLAANPPSSQ